MGRRRHRSAADGSHVRRRLLFRSPGCLRCRLADQGTVAHSAADWAGRPVQEHAGQHLEEVVAKRRAAQAAATQQPFGLSRCGDPLIPSPEPHEIWLNRP